MNYCRYRESDGYILEVNSIPLFEEDGIKVCLTKMDYIDNYDLYVIEVNEDNELIAIRGYLKEIGGGII